MPDAEEPSAASFPSEEDLLRELDVHDDLVMRCARGDLDFVEFNKVYDSIYVRFPLDGHESDSDGQQTLEKYEARIALHRDVWDEILTKVTADELATQPAAVFAGFIGSGEATRRLRLLWQRHSRGGGALAGEHES